MTKVDRQLITAAVHAWKRHLKGRTQGQLALKCGLRPNNFNEIVRGKRGVSMLPILRMSAHLEAFIELSELIRILQPAIYAERPDIFAKKEG